MIRGEQYLCDRFLHYSESRIHVPVPSHVHPSQKLKFLYHVIMTMGCVSTELDIFSSSNLLDAFHASKLIRTGDNPIVIVNKILKYLIE